MHQPMRPAAKGAAEGTCAAAGRGLRCLCTALHPIARQHGVNLLGPNPLGLRRPGIKLNASMLSPLAARGPLALVAQSGVLTAAMLDWARQHGVGSSAVLSLGPNTSIELPQVLDFLTSDAQTWG